VIAEPWPVDQCPACLHARSVALDAGGRLCLNCSHEWDPTTTTGPLAVTVDPGAADMIVVPLATPDIATIGPAEQINEATATARAAAKAAPPADLAAMVAAARAAYIGQTVLYFDAQAEGVVSEVDDTGLVTIDFGSGYSVQVYPDEFSLVAPATIHDATVAAIAEIDLVIGAQIIRAGVAAFATPEPHRTIGVGPEGWLPDDPDARPVIEHGASYAIAALAMACGITNAELLRVADSLETAASAAKEATEQ